MISKPSIIQSQLLLQFREITHGISTKLGGNDKSPFFNNLSFVVEDNEELVSLNRQKFFNSLNIDINRIAIPKQVHSANVQIINKPGSYPQTDALITQCRNVNLIITVADCFPILIFDKFNLIVAVVHSGWRGTQNQILLHALNKMITQFDSKPENLYVFIGPGICKDHFEVGKEVAGLFQQKYLNINNGKFFIDLQSDLLDQLSSIKIPKENIEFSSLCTFHEKEYLHSFRRDKKLSGKMMAVIGIR